MDIRIQLTVKEIREQGILDKFCELFHYNPATITDDQRAVLTLSQANKIGLKLDWGSEQPIAMPQTETPKKRKKRQ